MILLTALAALIRVPVEFYDKQASFGHHPGFDPFLSDLSFRAMSDWVIDQGNEWFDPDVVQLGDTVCVNVWFLPWFEKEVHPRIQHPYILISCDVGNWIPDPAAINQLLYDPKLAAWFCRNIFFSYHPKITQIPMGQTIYLFEHPNGGNTLQPLADLIAMGPFEKKHFLYMNHYPRSYGDREWIVRLFEEAPYCYSRNHSGEIWQSTPRNIYYRELAESEFVISPLGWEIDCIRNWEAFVLGCVPIVEHTFLDPLYDGLPIVFVHDWVEIDESFLLQEKKRIAQTKFEMERAYLPYWRSKIEETQRKVRSGDASFSKLEACLMAEDEIEALREILGSGNELICRGFLTGLRSLQLSEELGRRVFLFDPWMSQERLSQLSCYADNFFLPLNNRVTVFSSEWQYDRFLQNSTVPVFLDLAYYRNSLLRDFSYHRHRLLEDLFELLGQMGKGTLLVGNRGNDPYVQEVLSRLGIPIQRKGPFWYLVNL